MVVVVEDADAGDDGKELKNNLAPQWRRPLMSQRRGEKEPSGVPAC